MEIRDFLAFNVYFIIIFYMAALMFLRPPLKAILTSLLGGLLMALLTMGFDLLAYYAHWWHYAINGLTFHLPLPFYLTPVFIYGSLIYLLIWRFWTGKWHWLALLLLIGTPLFGIARDLLGGLTHTSYVDWENILLAIMATIVMWAVVFYAGFFFFKALTPTRSEPQVDVSGSAQGD